ncbi:uncharacterized protein TNCT_86871 [Trichonephila clavata]|uniref:Uncharacterized protein n=1 Tax=Trichonephila clavata TaxID=2740835 RepID=A0A8X6LMN2_TRICU|nr:uncharacterized protein TNCT_86871 [Trichonephila clavata]
MAARAELPWESSFAPDHLLTSYSNGACYLFFKNDTTEPSALPCSVIVYSSGAASIYALIMAIYHGYGTVVASRDSHIGRTMWVMPWLLINSFSVVLIFICACVYSVGLHLTCSDTTEEKKSCSAISEAYKSTIVAEVTEWIDVVLWGCLMGIEGIRLARNRRARAREVYIDPTTSDTVNIGNITPSA